LGCYQFLDIVLAFSIQALLSAPNPDDPLSDNIAKHWKANEAEAVETGKLRFTNQSIVVPLLPCDSLHDNKIFCGFAAKEWTRLYASGA
jgi:hypothetical protein